MLLQQLSLVEWPRAVQARQLWRPSNDIWTCVPVVLIIGFYCRYQAMACTCAIPQQQYNSMLVAYRLNTGRGGGSLILRFSRERTRTTCEQA